MAKRATHVLNTGIILAMLAAAAILGLGFHHSSAPTHAAVSTSYHHAMADVEILPPGD